MNTSPLHLRPARPLPALVAAAWAALSLLVTTPALAAPGAHGPNGEHLDAPAVLRAAAALPRVVTHSEDFELVAELRGAELVIVVDRYASNEPVLDASVEVESGALKAVARFRAEAGDYVVTDPALLKALAAPGEHGLVFTLVAGADSDLLDGTLVSATGAAAGRAANGDHDHGDDDHGHPLQRSAWIGAGIALLLLLLGIAWWRQRQRIGATPQGGL